MPSRAYPRGWKNALRNVFRPRLMELLVARVTRGRSPEDRLGRLPLNHYQYPLGSVRVVERLDLRLRLDLSDLVDWAIFYGLVDPGLERLLSRVRADEIVVDAGANNGFVTLRLAQRVGVRGRILSLEPHPDNFRRLSHNLSCNDFPQVTALPVGLGEAPGNVSMHSVDDFNLGMHRIAPDRSEVQRDHTVELTTLDQLCAEHASAGVDWVKLDVEGYELKVLRGGRRMLRELRPKLYVEVDHALLGAHGDSAVALLTELDRLGYDLVDAATEAPVTPPFDGVPAHFDVLCVPTS